MIIRVSATSTLERLEQIIAREVRRQPNQFAIFHDNQPLLGAPATEMWMLANFHVFFF